MVTIIAKNIDIARFQINLKTNCEGAGGGGGGVKLLFKNQDLSSCGASIVSLKMLQK